MIDIFSFKFLILLAIAIVILTFRARRKRKGPSVLPGKQIMIKGQKLQTSVTRSTPLECLLDEGKIFGEDYKDKEPPQLPHNENCSCELVSHVLRSHEWFNEKKKPIEEFETDLGMLNRTDFRYYKYRLIACHPDASEQIKADYTDLANGVSVKNDFKAKVSDYLSSKN